MKRLLYIALCLLVGIPSYAQKSWTIFRGDQQLLGVSKTTLPKTPKLMWSVKPGSGILAPPVVDQGLVVIGSENGTIYAIDSKGKVSWSFETDNAIEAPAMILDQTVYLGNLTGTLYAIDLTSGRKKWEYLTDNQISGSPNYWKNGKQTRLVVGSYDYYLHCVDAATGDSLWTYESDNFINGAAGCYDGKAIFGGCDGYLHIVNMATGKALKKVEVATYVASSVAVADDKAYIGDYDGRFSCVDLVKGEILWKFEEKEANLPFIGSPSILDDLVWKTNSGSRVDASPVIVGNQVLIANMRGDLQLLDLKTGKINWSYELGSGIVGNPAVCDGKIWCAASDGYIYCFGQ